MIYYSSSEKNFTNLGYTPDTLKLLTLVQEAVLPDCHAYLRAIEKYGGRIGLRVDFSGRDASPEF